MLEQWRLKELLKYDPNDGRFFRIKSQGTTKVGDVAGYCKFSYTYICIDRKEYPAHRLFFLYMYGVLAKCDIDHIDMNRNNNKLENLRQVSRSENMLNTRTHRDSKSRCKNVFYRNDTKKFSVRLSINGVYKTIGSYDDLELADLVACCAREKYHGLFARHD